MPISKFKQDTENMRKYRLLCKNIEASYEELDEFLVSAPPMDLFDLGLMKIIRDKFTYIIMGYHLKSLKQLPEQDYLSLADGKQLETIRTRQRVFGAGEGDKSTSTSRTKKKVSGPIPRVPAKDGGKLAGLDLSKLSL